MSLCCRNALNKEVLSFPQHAPKQWHYCMMAKLESTVPLSSAAIIAETENRKGKFNSTLGKKISIFSLDSSPVLHKYFLQRKFKRSREGTARSEQLKIPEQGVSLYNSKCTEKWRNMRINCHWRQWEVQIRNKFGKENTGNTVIFMLLIRCINLGNPLLKAHWLNFLSAIWPQHSTDLCTVLLSQEPRRYSSSVQSVI